MKAGSSAEKRQTAEEIVNGFKEVGFIYLDKHGIPGATVKNAFGKVRQAFLIYYVLANIHSYTECRTVQTTSREQGKHCNPLVEETRLICSPGQAQVDRPPVKSWLRCIRPRTRHTVLGSERDREVTCTVPGPQGNHGNRT